jgi:hypothetical protein
VEGPVALAVVPRHGRRGRRRRSGSRRRRGRRHVSAVRVGVGVGVGVLVLAEERHRGRRGGGRGRGWVGGAGHGRRGRRRRLGHGVVGRHEPAALRRLRLAAWRVGGGHRGVCARVGWVQCGRGAETPPVFTRDATAFGSGARLGVKRGAELAAFQQLGALSG